MALVEATLVFRVEAGPNSIFTAVISIVAFRCHMVYNSKLMPKLRTNIYLTDKQKAALEKLSDKTGAPVAELIRRAIDAYLASRKKELK